MVSRPRLQCTRGGSLVPLHGVRGCCGKRQPLAHCSWRVGHMHNPPQLWLATVALRLLHAHGCDTHTWL